MSKQLRKRIKMECEECGSQFDDDYQTRHEKFKHNGKHVKVKLVGAPLNPFEASKRKTGVPSVLPSLSSSSSSSSSYVDAPNLPTKRKLPPVENNAKLPSEVSLPSKELPVVSIPVSQRSIAKAPSTSSTVQSSTLSLETESSVMSQPTSGSTSGSTSGLTSNEESPVVSIQVFQPSIIKVSSTSSTKQSSTVSSETESSVLSQLTTGSTSNKVNVDSTWIIFSGKVEEFMTNFERVNQILGNMKKEEVPNLKEFFVNIIECLTNIHKESDVLLEAAKKEEDKLDRNKTHHLCVGSEVLMDHDPGKRSKITTANERKYLSSLGPYQPKLGIYPTNSDIPSNKQCRFNPAWYSEYSFLEYSPYKDAAFCFACTLFSEGIGRHFANPEWVSIGVRQWHKMKSRGKKKEGKLIQHFTSESHRAALRDYCHFVNGGGHVDVLLDTSAREEKIREEQEKAYHLRILQVLIDVARTLGRQGLAFRGHDESLEDCDGNFRQIVLLISRHCPLMKKWLDESSKRPRHVTYLSPRTQNEFIDLLGTRTQKAIVDEINSARIFSVMVDTTPDSSHQDRLAINIRYLVETNNGPVPTERLLKMDVVLTKKTGEELAQKIVVTLQTLGISVENIVFQSYDFAKNMSGKYNGTQQKLSEKCNKKIPYIPCQAHRINIFVETACNASVLIKEFFNVLEALYVFFYGSTKRYQRMREEFKNIENSLQLKNLSKTRWTARAETVKAVWISFEGIVHALEEIKTDAISFDINSRTSASGLLKKILHFDFISSLYFCKNVMFKVKNLTENLEGEELNVIDALLLIQSTSGSFQQMNDDDSKIDALIKSSSSFAEKLHINPENDFLKHHRTRRVPRRIDENPETAFDFDFLTFYRKEFRTVLQIFTTCITNNLKDTFSTFEPLQKIFEIPVNRSNVTIESVESISQLEPKLFQEEPECLFSELQILLDSCTKCTNFEDISKVVFNLKNVIPLAYKLVCFILTAPVTSASCERSFSKLKLVLNHLRTTMGDDRLNALMLLYSSKDIVDKIHLSEVVREWSLLKHRRMEIRHGAV